MIINVLSRILFSLQNHKNRIAFHINDQDYTYENLSTLIFSIQKKINHETGSRKIGVITSNTIESYAAQLSIWFSGNTFVPLNPRNPIARNLKVIEEGDITTIMHYDYKDVELFAGHVKELINTANLEISSGIPELAQLKRDDLAYILFTSGSTGIPKGVQISWENLDAFADSIDAYGFELGENERFLQMFDFSFDVSVASTIIPLMLGMTVYSVPESGMKFTEVLSILEEKEITFASIVPSMLTFLRPYFDEISLPQLKNCILTAEASHNDLVAEWSKCVPNSRIFNFYGPTEATVWCTAYEWDKDWKNQKEYNGMPPIGKELKNVKTIIIDDNNTVLPAGEKGELCLGGTHVTRGYLNDSLKNKTSFVIINNERYYKTGDICFADPDGDIMYCGRLDHQIQLRGYRVELNEIEYPIKKHFELNNALAIPVENENGNTRVILFVEGYKGETSELMQHLKSVIPYYMMPDKIIGLDKFPTNSSDKIDRKRLLEYIKE